LGGVVPLSEHEQRQLEQIEQALYREDRRLARLVRSSDPRVHYRRRMAEAVIGLVLGVAMIVAGILFSVIYLTIAGFVVMLLCGIWALNSWRQSATVALGAATAAGAPAATGKRKSRRSSRRRGSAAGGPRGSFGERLDERWRRRQEGDF
jgi:membrane protein implicated in regulation of membrane protease activity